MKIRKKEFISLKALHDSRRVWWIDSRPTLKKWVERDMKKSNHLKTIKVGDGRGVRYYFKPENVETFVREFEKGDF